MPRKKAMEDPTVDKLKELAIGYYGDVPVLKYTAMHIGREYDTLKRWMDEDSVFAGQMNQARVKSIQKRIKRVKDEWFLERIEKDVFAERKELTGEGGKDLTVQVVSYLEKADGANDTN